ncbi:vimentin-type intermediate filament-associated coiled-coil protein [Sceloporus undulatus]|uniref:vimentin-type intermediate filament-associated coiled-coil protein n=1 Tax=Sceloporus undulatus TaxID=8520 RepID=UPI001C4DA168|nr:vimentin-type intermediate filament-associated coiled-coil protein [Sceloporus undulatus]
MFSPSPFFSPHREIAALEEKLQSSEEKTQQLLSLIQEKDHLISQLCHRSHLLSKICRSHPVLDNLLAYMAEGERLNPILGGRSSPELGPSLEMNCLLSLDLDGTNDFSLGVEEEEDEDHNSEQTLFGTTV